MKHFTSFIKRQAWAASLSDGIDIPRGNLLRRLIVKVYGSFTLAAGSAAGKARSEAPATIFNKIELKGNDYGSIKTFDGTGLFLSTLFHNRGTFPFSLVGAGAAAGHTFVGVFTIDLALPHKGNIRPADTFLDTRRFSTLRLEFDWAANLRDAMFTGNDRTESASLAYIEVYGEYETPHADFGETLVYQQGMIVSSVTAANTDHRIELPVGFTYKNVLMSAQNKAAGGQYTGNDAMINSYSLEYNSNIYPLNKIGFVAKQYTDTLDFELSAIHTGTNFNLFDLDGMIKESIVTLGGSNLTYVMDVNAPAGTNQIRLYHGTLNKWSSTLRGEICKPTASSPMAIGKAKTVKALS